ncbi:MAG: hypothetical protein HOO96_23885 [Polyangiaceae bacterium]|nr:hypothetical protein [Polyangiaceae bacterium]
MKLPPDLHVGMGPMLRPSLLIVASLAVSASSAPAQQSLPRRAKVSTPAGAATRPPRSGRDTAELTVIARLRDTGTRAPPCGKIAAIGIHRYEVLQVVSGHYDHHDLFVAVPCPADFAISAPAPAAYVAGAVFQLQVARGLLEGSVFDAFAKDKSPRYLLHGEPIPAQAP